MKTRCRSKKRHNAHRYSERGITYCDRWESFENFLADMGPRPEGRSLDRIDSNKGYSPDNCRWATPEQQTNNRAASTLKDRTGQRFSSLVFLSFSHSDGKRTYWRTQCDCGTIKIFDASDVARGHTKSCGCSQFKRPINKLGQWVAR